MEDNGLLKYYKSKYHSEDGYLNSKDIKFKHVQNLLDTDNICKVDVDKKPYYIKEPHFICETDAEVLLGQVYAKAGLKSAIYLPINMHGKYGIFKGVVSNDVLKNGKTASEFCDSMTILSSFPTKTQKDTELIEEYFERKVLKQIVALHALDVASFNIDRSLHNFGFEVKDDVATGVSTFDNGICFETIKGYKIAKDNFSGQASYLGKFDFYNYLGNLGNKTRKDMIETIKTNETVNSLVTPGEISEMIGGINIPKIADDIKDTIGFEVDKYCVEVLDASFTNMAEELSK